MLPWLVVKELGDNALDSADAAGHPGAVEISVDPRGNLIVTDAGTGLPDATAEQIAKLFCVDRPMVSSKLLRRPTRGAVGNGLRVCLGYLTATRGKLVIETGSLRVELAPEIDGSSRIVGSSTSKPRQGLRLTAFAGDAPFADEHLAWAKDAIELAQQSGEPSFTGRPSPHWFDCDHFRTLLRAAVGNPSVRQFLHELDGCAGSRAQTKIAVQFLRRPVADLTVTEAADLLAAAQAATKPPKARVLRPLGRDAVISAGYAIAEGAFTEGEHAPYVEVPFLVECWADGFFPDEQTDHLTSVLYMNRTRAMAPCTGNAWHGQLDLSISGTALHVPVPAGPDDSIEINITSPTFRLTSDAKTPDCQPFREALIEAIGKAAKQAGRDIAAQMSSEQKRAATHRQRQQCEDAQAQRLADREMRQKRLAQIEALKTERKALPTIRDVVLELLPGALEIELASGLMFGTRRLVYRIRDQVLRRTGKELTQSYFEDLLTDIEAEKGDLSPLLYREPRGSFSIPHRYGSATPLGTLTVRAFQRPAWTFNKVLLIEKEDLRLMLEQAGWGERNDCLLMSCKGYSTRAGRDLIDAIAETTEPVKVFCVHDADAAGTLIQHTVQHATKARAARKIEVIDLGLQPWEGVALGLDVERVVVEHRKDGTPKRRPVGDYVREREGRIKGETWEQWLQHARFELNAFTSAQLIDWLDRKMAEHGTGKLIPPDDILIDGFGERVRNRAEQAVEATIEKRTKDRIAAVEAERERAIAPIRMEIASISGPLLAEISRLTAHLDKQLAEVSEPFKRRIAATYTEASEINREVETHRAIKRTIPTIELLRAGIDVAFSESPSLHWVTVLGEIAEVTEIGAIEIHLGDAEGGAA